MTRENARELALHLIYSRSFTGDDPAEMIQNLKNQAVYSALAQEHEIYAEQPDRNNLKYLTKVVVGVRDEEAALNEIISKYAIDWDISRISRLSRSIMQLAIYEIRYCDNIPTNVSVSEAVRLTKLYDTESAGFVNGILGNYVRSGAASAVPAETEEV